MKLLLTGAFIALTSFTVSANDAEMLKSRLTALDTYKASFSQSVTDEQGEVVHESTGQLTMARPDKLRWQTITPDETVLIADGNSVWHIDAWVEQVTVMSQHQAIDNNPMVLLTSNDATIWNQYTITAVGEGAFNVTAKEEGGQIRALTLSFDSEGLASLNMLDSQGQKSHILFSQREFNQPVSSAVFIAAVPDTFMVDDQRP